MINELRSLRWADYFLFALYDPRALCRQIVKNEPRCFLLSFIVPAVIAIIDILAVSILGKETSFFYYKITYGWIQLFIFIVMLVALAAALMDSAVQLMGFPGKIRELLILLNFSLVPGIFILPLVYVFKVFHFAPIFFFILFFVLLCVWSMLIAIQGMSELHGSGIGRAAVICLAPVVLAGTMTLFLGVLFMIISVGYIAG